MLENKKKYPKCFGFYSRKDTQCDGDRNGHSPVEKMYCAMRDRCVALRKHCKVNKLRVSNYMQRERIVDEDGERRSYCFTHLEDDDLKALLNKTIESWGIVNGRVTRAEPAKIEVKAKKRKNGVSLRKASPMDEKTKKKISEASKSAASDAIDRARDLCMRFFQRISMLSDKKISTTKNASVGDLVVVDRMKNSRYMSIYLEAKKQRRVAIAAICPSVRTRKAEIRIAVPLKHFRKSEIDKLFLIEFSDGKFVTKTGKMDIEGMAIMAEIICRFIGEGIIKAPSGTDSDDDSDAV